MKKIVRKIKKVNIKFLFATLLVAIIAVTSSGMLLTSSKDSESGLTDQKNTTNDAVAQEDVYVVKVGEKLKLGKFATFCPRSSNEKIVKITTGDSKTEYDFFGGSTTYYECTAETLVGGKALITYNGNSVATIIVGDGYALTLTVKKGDIINIAKELIDKGLDVGFHMTGCGKSSDTSKLRAPGNSCNYTALDTGEVTYTINGYTAKVKIVSSTNTNKVKITYKPSIVADEFAIQIPNSSTKPFKNEVTVSYDFNKDITLPNVTAPSNYKFTGWVYDYEDCNNTTKRTTINVGSSNKTMKACFVKNSSYISPNKNKVKITYKPSTVIDGLIIHMPGSTSKYMGKGVEEYYKYNSTVTLPTFTYTGNYKFIGWVYENQYSTSKCSSAVKRTSINAGTMSQTLVACFEKIKTTTNTPPAGSTGSTGSTGNSGTTKVTVQFDASNADGTTLACNGTDLNNHAQVCSHQATVGGRINLPAEPTKAGYKFLGWAPASVGSNCASNLVATTGTKNMVAKESVYLAACFVPATNSSLRQDTCTPDIRNGVIDSDNITHCIKTVCKNGKVQVDQTNVSTVTCAPGYTKVTSTKAIGGTCSTELGKSCTGNATGSCTQIWHYECVPSGSLKFSKTSISLSTGQKDNLFNYLGYKGIAREDIKFSYAKNGSGNDVIDLGSDGSFTAKNTGRITVYAKGGGAEATIEVIVGSGKSTCYNSLTSNEDHEAGESGIIRHCIQGTCTQWKGFAFNTTANSNYQINCVSGSKVSILKTDTCESLKGVCTPGDKVQCYQEWAWQCMPSNSNRTYYTVTYNYLNDAGDVQNVKVASGDLAPNTYATRTNYTFDGWYLEGQKFDFNTPISGDIVLNAMWICNGSNCDNGEDSTGVSSKDAPTCTLKMDTDDWAHNKKLTVNINLGKNQLAENYINISKDNKRETGWHSTPYYNITENGVYTVRVRDEKGLESTCKIEETKIDRTKPTVDGNWDQGETMQITLRGVDDQSGVVKYFLTQDPKDAPHEESSKWVTNPTFTVDEFGLYYAWVMDGAGNISNKIEISDTKDITYAPDAVLTGLSAQADGGVEESRNQAQAMAMGLQRNYHMKRLANSNDLIAFTFSPNKLKYELKVRSSKISLYATLPKGSSFVEGYEPKENQELEYGLNTIFIKVKDSQGRVRTYTVLVTREDDRSGVNLLSDLTVSGTTFTFSPYKTEYTVKVPKGTTAVTINGSLSDPTALFVEGFQPREITLEDDATDALIKVQSASGAVRTYIIHIVKEGTTSNVPSPSTKGSNYLSSLTIAGVNFNFDKEVLDYNVSVTNEIESVNIYAFAEDRAATVNIYGGGSLRVGENTVTVTVTSTTGRSRTYTIKVIRKEDELGISSNTELSTLNVGGYDIKFKPNKLNYELKIDKEKTLVIMATPKSDRSNVYIVGNEDLSTFSTLKISVVAEDGSTSVYSIDISKDAWNTRIEIIIAAIGLAVAVGATVVIQTNRKKKKKALNQD